MHRSIMVTYCFLMSSCCSADKIVQNCYSDPVIYDCLLSDWGEWNTCSGDCGFGIQSRRRDFLELQEHRPDGDICGRRSMKENRLCWGGR
uniref:Spondin-like TSP1 domain-containing protein n=1 Tax=Plectus sambesii TaxID=2011161 RepID=A0A914VNA3_9BILA